MHRGFLLDGLNIELFIGNWIFRRTAIILKSFNLIFRRTTRGWYFPICNGLKFCQENWGSTSRLRQEKLRSACLVETRVLVFREENRSLKWRILCVLGIIRLIHNCLDFCGTHWIHHVEIFIWTTFTIFFGQIFLYLLWCF